MNNEIKLTQYSHGGGCGCKIAPGILDEILKSTKEHQLFPGLLVGNDKRDDAAVFDLGNGTSVISTTDFFMPIVDDAFDFGRIASANAISDIYAMGGTPLMAIAILGWPVNKIPVEACKNVIEGAKNICNEAKIPLAGGHSIDCPEPVFGLAVTGLVNNQHIKKNGGSQSGDLLFFTKKLGTGILGSATKKGIISDEQYQFFVNQMCTLNKIGTELGKIPEVTAMTDVTGFGFLGHLVEMMESSKMTAEISFSRIPIIEGLDSYIHQNAIPGNTARNFQNIAEKVNEIPQEYITILCDPQTSGGLLFSVNPSAVKSIEEILFKFNPSEFEITPIGIVKEKSNKLVVINS